MHGAVVRNSARGSRVSSVSPPVVSPQPEHLAHSSSVSPCYLVPITARGACPMGLNFSNLLIVLLDCRKNLASARAKEHRRQVLIRDAPSDPRAKRAASPPLKRDKKSKRGRVSRKPASGVMAHLLSKVRRRRGTSVSQSPPSSLAASHSGE